MLFIVVWPVWCLQRQALVVHKVSPISSGCYTEMQQQLHSFPVKTA